MRKISRIARAELSSLFYSPIAWLLLIIFTIQCGLGFIDGMKAYMGMEKLRSLFPSIPPEQATLTIMTHPSLGMFSDIVKKLYLYLPLLTMGLVSREISNGTIRLLNSSPVKTGQVVLGKFMAIAGYNFLLVTILALFAGAAVWAIPHADTGMLLSALLGFFLLLSAYAAIGLFMSCLTSYPVVAAISTLAVFAILNYINKIGQGIDIVRELTELLSIGLRTQDMFSGLITSRDVFYFLIITGMFLAFSVLRLQADKKSRSFWNNVMRYTAVLAIAIGVGYFTSRPSVNIYWDATAAKSNTIAPYTQELLKSTKEEPLVFTTYINLLDTRYMKGAPAARQSYLRIWEKYARFKPIDFKYVYYYDTVSTMSSAMRRHYSGKTIHEVAQEFAKTNNVSLDRFLQPEAARAIPGLSDEKGRMIMQLTYKNKSQFLRMYDDPNVWPTEGQFATALKTLTIDGVVPKIGFLEGQLERSPVNPGDRNYTAMMTAKGTRYSLINNGFETTVIPAGEEIPTDLTVLVIADPKVAFSNTTMEQLRRYIASGGNLLVTGEPGKQPVLNPLWDILGVQMSDGILVQQNKNEVPDLITPHLTEISAEMSEAASRLYRSGAGVFMQGAAALLYNDARIKSDVGTMGHELVFEAKPLLLVDEMNGWLKKGNLVNDSAAVTFSEKDGDLNGAFAPAVALTRTINGRDQKIALTGDADFMSYVSIGLRPVNHIFCTALFKWLSEGSFPVEVSRLDAKDYSVAISDEQLFALKVFFVFAIPALLLVGGFLLLIRRKRK